MKNVSEVLTHLLISPGFEKFRELKDLGHFMQMLPLSLKNGIAFSYVKDKVLFLALKHACFKQEFYHKIPLVKQLLKQYQRQLGVLLDVADIKVFVTYDAYQQAVENTADTPLTFGEQSTGAFENLAKDAKLYSIFENIRSSILKHQDL